MYLFADEAGNFDFSTHSGASKFWILGTVTIDNPGPLGEEILSLRRKLAWQGLSLESEFHATEDRQIVRDAVFDILKNAEFRVDSTILEKRKTQLHLQRNKERFYKEAWHLHFKYVGPQVIQRNDDLLVIAASIGTRKRRRAIRLGIEDVVLQSVGGVVRRWEVAFWPAAGDPCLQVADYCTWAIQRKYELGDKRSYQMIENKIFTEFEPFRGGRRSYY